MKKLLRFLQVAVLVLIFQEAGAKKLFTDVNLKWKPTTETDEFHKATFEDVLAAKIKVETFTDARTSLPKMRVGENREDETEVLPVETTDNVAEFVTTNFAGWMEKLGIPVVTTGEQYTLSGEIKEYFVTETNTYKGVLTLKLVLKKGNKQVWNGVVVGENKRFGRSYKMDNYHETLSDVIIEAVRAMLQSEKFKQQFAH